jgi:colicin import membrane protein
MTAGERREESVEVSLKELERLEAERLDRERREREARARAAEHAREQARARDRAELEARKRAEAEARERARRAEIEEEARREAMSRAAVEQARIAVETRARTEEADRERRHELELARLQAEAKRQSNAGPIACGALAGFALAALTCAGLFFGLAKPASDRTIATLEASLDDASAKARELQRESLDQDRRIKQLEATLERERRDADASGATGASSATGATGAASVGRTGHGRPPRRTVGEPPKIGAAPDPCATSHDPLCGLDRGKH